MSEDEMSERRVHPRRSVAMPGQVHLLFPFPDPAGPPCTVPLHDVSYGGISFRVTEETLAIESGWTSRATLRFGLREVHGSMLVVHVTPEPHPGALCGAIFFPDGPDDRKTLRIAMTELEAE